VRPRSTRPARTQAAARLFNFFDFVHRTRHERIKKRAQQIFLKFNLNSNSRCEKMGKRKSVWLARKEEQRKQQQSRNASADATLRRGAAGTAAGVGSSHSDCSMHQLPAHGLAKDCRNEFTSNSAPYSSTSPDLSSRGKGKAPLVTAARPAAAASPKAEGAAA